MLPAIDIMMFHIITCSFEVLMKYYSRLLFIIVLTASILTGQSKKLIWKAELEDNVKKIQPVLNGKYLFLSSDEYAWLYENATGKKVWNVEIDEYSDKAIHTVVNDTLYLVANEDTLVCYDMVNRSVQWKRWYKGIEQSQFSGLAQVDTLLIVSYSTLDIGISLNDGNEAWRTPIEYQRSLIEAGTVNSFLLPTLRKYFVITEKNDCVLLSMDDGKKLLSLPLSEPHGDLVKGKRAWSYISPDQTIAAFIFEKNYIVINTVLQKLVAQIPVKVSDQYNPLMPTAVGCAVIGEDRIVHLNSITGKVSQIPSKVDDLRNIIVTQTDSAAIMIVGLEDKIIGWNLDIGKIAWQTALKFQPANGFLHKFLVQDSNDVIVTYLDPSNGLRLYIMSINAPTGKINYRTLIAHADESLQKRTLPIPAIGKFTGPVLPSFGFEEIGFEYQVSVESESAVFVIRTGADMLLPNTEKPGGEGFVRVDITNGQILSKNYMKIADGVSFDGGLASIAKTMKTGNMILCPGNKNLVALDASNGSIRWMLIEQDLNGSYIFDMAMIDTVLFVRTGGSKQGFTYDAKKDKISKKMLWEEDDYLLLAVDTATGKVLWKREFEADPGQVFHGYSISQYAKGNSNLFFADEKFLYSLSLSPERKGMLSWKFEFSDSGVGSMDYEDLFQRSTSWNNEKLLTADWIEDSAFQIKKSVIAGESFTISLSRILHVEYHRQADRLLLFGDDGIASVNASTGRRNWHYEWDYDAATIHQRPVQLNGHIFYIMDGYAVVVNTESGKVVSTTKIDSESAVVIMPDNSSVLVVDSDEVTGIVIP